MSDAFIKFDGNNVAIASHGGNDNPAVRAIMAAMFTPDLPSLNFSKGTTDVQVQAGGFKTNSGGIGF